MTETWKTDAWRQARLEDPMVRNLLSAAEGDEPQRSAVARTAGSLGVAGLVNVETALTGSVEGLAAPSAAQMAAVSAPPAASAPVSGLGSTAPALSVPWLGAGAVIACAGLGCLAALLASSPSTSSERSPVTDITASPSAPVTNSAASPSAPTTAEAEARVDPVQAVVPRPPTPDSTPVPPKKATALGRVSPEAPKRKPGAAAGASRVAVSTPARSAQPGPQPAKGQGSQTSPASIGDDIALLDRARRELSFGFPEATLRSLNEMSPAGASALAHEVQILRIRALSASGARAEAARQARAFIRAHPESPHSRGLESMIGKPDPLGL